MIQTLLNNRYRLIRPLGAGGFGETYLAEDTQMPSGRRCVIKQLKPITNEPQIYQLVKERFQREAAILEELGAANNQIPHLYAYFESNGQFYLVQEWIEGVTLADKVQQEGKLSESSVKEILIGLLPVLNYVHGKRIVHRDIKPDNIISRYSDGKPVLIDFGAVRETMGTVVTSQGNTAQSIVIGTPGFMPSEQSVGRPVYASDIYSLGLTAIYLLTGRIPQEIETDPGTGEILWRRYALSVTPTFAAILDKAIQSHPRDRYSTAREMLEALQTGTAPSSPTIYSSQPTEASHPPRRELPHTVPIGTPPQLPGSGQTGILLGSLIAGGLIGASVIVGLALTKSPQASIEQSLAQAPSSPTPSNSPTVTPPNVPTQSQSPAQSPVQPAPPQFPAIFQSSLEPTFTAPPPVTRPSPAQAVQNYYSAINNGQYQSAWNQLSIGLQTDDKLHPQSYNSYKNFWQTIRQVTVEEATPLEASPEVARVLTRLKFVPKVGQESHELLRIKLVWDATKGEWLYDDAKLLN
jgi:serine/threonine-protein kinase